MKSFTHRAFTIVELLVVVAIISLLIAILLPAIGKAKDGALVTQSIANLNNLGKANATYGADWQDRQFTACADDYGSVAGVCGTYIGSVACPPQQILGWDAGGGLWGYWLGGGLCPGNYPGNCGNWIVYWPQEWASTNGYFGAWRMPNVKAFNDYVNGKFYDKVYWAPKDKVYLEKATEAMANPGEFSVPPNPPVYSTYCWSPAAMWSPDVLSSTTLDCTNAGKPQNCGPGAWRSPASSQASYPDLKTRMIEHQWLQNKGLRKSACMAAPLRASAPPVTAANSTRGRRSSTNTERLNGSRSAPPPTIAKSSDQRIGTAPDFSASSMLMNKPNNMATQSRQ